MKQKCYYIFQINQNNNWMFRGSSYSIQTDKDISFSHLLEERVNIALVGVSDVGKSSLLNCIEVDVTRIRRNASLRTFHRLMTFNYVSREYASTTICSLICLFGMETEIACSSLLKMVDCSISMVYSMSMILPIQTLQCSSNN